jgi:hypothetical protein
MMNRIMLIMAICAMVLVATGCTTYYGVAKTSENKAIVVGGTHILWGPIPKAWLVDLETGRTETMEVEK